MPDSTATPAYSLPIAAEASAPRSGLLARAWRVGRRRPAALVGALVVLLFVVMAVGAPWLAPSDPVRTDWSKIRKAPSWAHPFGHRRSRRATASRASSGERASRCRPGVFSILLAMLIGVPVGLVRRLLPRARSIS